MKSQRGGTMILVIIALAVLLVSAVVILRSSGIASTVAGNIAFRTSANQVAEVAINTAITNMYCGFKRIRPPQAPT